MNSAGDETAEEANGEEVGSLEEARKLIKDLRERHRMQALQVMIWRRRMKAQEDLVARLCQDRSSQLRVLSSQLLLFEARLCRKQRDISSALSQREAVISRQQRVIRSLQQRLADAGLAEAAEEANLDSLNDSDSAVIMEDDDYRPFHGLSDGVTIVRSVSDAVELPPTGKYPPLRRSNGFLRRPEILETVYSVEEDPDGDQTCLGADSGGPQTPQNPPSHPQSCPEDSWSQKRSRLKEMYYGSFEKLDHTGFEQLERTPDEQSSQPPCHVTYNRVMSNHRSVTKPKDVKYKRINKAKSKSLEELRGRLKNWVEKGNKLAVSLDQSFA
ncbi:uncharacterized protein LOC111046638 [Nilaparvata lugens]|uniref:uncharacterized protein LOC111046638 n=1 Tax=Nilaparvata lugens TaxID=108931 RepID=UPI00193D4DC9|nr:uncharacterized protein LOC111046638 [Nilaparvata lugens]